MKKLFKSPFVILVLICLPAIYFLLRPGFYEPQDLHHIADIFQMYKAVVSGQLPPRLGPDYLWGFGYPLFNLYYVLPFYLGAVFYALTKSLTGSFEFVFVVAASLSIFGMYLFLREFFGKIASLTGSILYLYTPYRAVQIYVRGAMGEALAMAVIPFVFWGATRVVKEPSRANISILGLTLAALILSHNYLWLLAAPFLALFCLVFLYRKESRGKSVKVLILGVLLGAGASSYWWLPAVKEFNLVSGITPFALEDHFPFIKQLLLPSWGYGASVWGPYDGMSFQVGVVNLAVVAGSLVIIFLKRKNLGKYGSILALAIGGFFVSVVMMNIRTLPLWKLLPIYQFVQFPWRLLFLTTFFSAILGAFLIDAFSRKIALWVGLAVAVLSISLTWGYFRPSQVVYKPDDFYLTRMFAIASEGEERIGVSQDYINWSEDYLLLPLGVKKADRLFTPKIVGDENATVLEIEKINQVDYRAEVEARSQAKVTFYSLYFPGWTSTLDGVSTQITQGEPFGQMEVTVAQGRHTVEFSWKETPQRLAADLVSLISLGIGVWLLLDKRGRRDATT
ncbi:hypothetical protein A2V56_00815 [Candidatus Woesebacteria bacterium RBG_19FT_COMBO_42_9]|uniref:Membrane protein 6-pyruvoyl-tetrahydropterin synthase-related domain-containing protein n=1 Tax=Candidatus Woesebacteria bacterium RBG_16_42_24 TaxID=1802485 RepID=A0A1F7XKE0_9BACT|nr:MAG: hypothetical protein A2V97_02470 [Candidatus Woesebacteria bacterium RBG_16_42_24]OGM17707.1 MAG: hypothetical protein A2V56_00815 [Candidatus Woesebacteria bacterium RBG_19FT_COMBO_42_9]OGM68350.1 MAG: hypothetical protein A2985_02330 [Candidatus Woesebacteria bacterium RIFCSPLOWO2_01_FULL_43_11]